MGEEKGDASGWAAREESILRLGGGIFFKLRGGRSGPGHMPPGDSELEEGHGERPPAY